MDTLIGKVVVVLNAVWDWVDTRQIIRRIVLFGTLWLTWDSYQWAATFATTTDRTSLDIAAIIAAVTAPMSILQGYIFKIYADGRNAN